MSKTPQPQSQARPESLLSVEIALDAKSYEDLYTQAPEVATAIVDDIKAGATVARLEAAFVKRHMTPSYASFLLSAARHVERVSQAG